MPVYKTLNHYFFKTWSPEMAYVLGYFAADGSMIENNRGGHYVEFTTTDRVLLQNLLRAVKGSQKISTRPNRNKNSKPQYRLQFGCKQWFLDLQKHGFTPHKSKTLHFPKVPRKHVADFIRGYFDGDGCVYFKKLKYADRKYMRWVLSSLFTSGSKKFLQELHLLLRSYGVHGGSIKNKERGFELVFSHRDSLALYRLMYQNINTTGLYLPRKLRLFKKAIKTLYPDADVSKSFRPRHSQKIKK